MYAINKRPLTPTLSTSASKTRANALMARKRWGARVDARGERERTECVAPLCAGTCLRRIAESNS
jgi:hypothetical protein